MQQTLNLQQLRQKDLLMQQPEFNLFGTDGIRATLGTAPLTLEQLARLGKAIACWSQERYGPRPHIILAQDTRESCSFMKAALQSGLLLYPLNLYDAHVLSTPALCQNVQKQTLFHAGIMISASHNPYHDNGIKIIDANKGKLSLHDELRISALFQQLAGQPTDYSSCGSVTRYDDATTIYRTYVTTFFPPLFLRDTRIVIDCAHGATSQLAPPMFEHFGAQLITLNNQPNGKNINQDCGALYPQQLQAAVIEHDAHIGFAFDGDGDRVIAVNQHGEIKNGDDILAILLQHPAYKDTPALVGTVMTNHGFEKYIEAQNKKLLRTAVGDKYITDCLHKEQLLIGGEQSGHIILRDYLAMGDGLFTALRVAQVLTQTNDWAMHTFEKYPQLLLNIPIAVKKDLSSPVIANIIQDSKTKLHSGRLVVRYSGTENILRIMIEDQELGHAHYIGSLLSQALQKELSNA